MPQPFVLPATAGRTDLLAQACAFDRGRPARARTPGFLAAVAPRAARTARHESRTVLARPPGDGEPSRADRRHAKPRAADRRRRRDPAASATRTSSRKPTASRCVPACRGRKAHAAPTRSAPRSHRPGRRRAWLRTLPARQSHPHLLVRADLRSVRPHARHARRQRRPARLEPHTLALVRMSAQLIENHLFANQCAEALRLRFHAHEECVDSLFAASPSAPTAG